MKVNANQRVTRCGPVDRSVDQHNLKGQIKSSDPNPGPSVRPFASQTDGRRAVWPAQLHRPGRPTYRQLGGIWDSMIRGVGWKEGNGHRRRRSRTNPGRRITDVLMDESCLFPGRTRTGPRPVHVRPNLPGRSCVCTRDSVRNSRHVHPTSHSFVRSVDRSVRPSVSDARSMARLRYDKMI